MKKSSERKAEIRASVIENLKGLILPGILTLIILGVVAFVATYKAVTDEEEPPVQVRSYEGEASEYVLESDGIKFVMDPNTTQFTVTNKKTGAVWTSSPEDAANDTFAQTVEKEKLQSTVVINYSDTTGADSSYNTFKHSQANSIYEIEATDDQIKVLYSIGEVEQEFVYPPLLTEEEYLDFTSRLDKSNANYLSKYFSKYDINNPTRSQKKTLDDDKARYPLLEESVCYIAGNNLGKGIRKKLQQIFEEAGYTYEEYVEHKLRDTSETVSNKPIYNLSVIYSLDGDDLIVEVPFSEIEYPSKKPLYRISLLPNFGAGGVDETGYMLVPEGGGALINFNNGKTSQNAYYSALYGWDYASIHKERVHETSSSFGVFGIAKENDSFICIIEDGDAYANINAIISGKSTSYNEVNAEYTILARDSYDITKRSNVANYQYQDHFAEGEGIRQRYVFIDSSSYVDMAKTYREYLLEKYSGNFTKNSDSQTPMLLEVIGAIDKIQQVVGVPMDVPLGLTECDETTQIVSDLQSQGIKNISLKLTGYINGGVKQQWLNKVKTVSKLGSKKDFEKMIDDVKNMGVNVYLDGITDYAINSDFWDGFSIYNDVAHFANKERAKLYEFSTTTFAQRDDLDCYYLLSNKNVQKMCEKFVEATKNFGAYPSFQNIGNDLSGDYSKKAFYTRQMVLNQQDEFIKSIANEPLMINEGNAYIAPYATIIDNMDFDGSGYTILDEMIPFYQIALHGYVNYVGESLNLTGDFNDELLRSAEYGAGLSFTVMDESPFTLQNTLYYMYFGSEYDACRDRIIETYSRYNNELGHLFNQEIENHEFINSDLTVTTYEDGTKVYVNYSYNDDFTVDGVTIKSRDYVVVK